jgi:hypothetical protein
MSGSIVHTAQHVCMHYAKGRAQCSKLQEQVARHLSTEAPLNLLQAVHE